MRLPCRIILACCCAPVLLLAADSSSCAKAVDIHRSGNAAAALALYEDCLNQGQPGAPEMRSNYGAALAHEGRYQDAISQYNKALEASPGNPPLRFNLALAYYKLGDLAGASKQLESLQTVAPGNMQVTLLLADCYLRVGENRKIIDLLGPLQSAHGNDAGFAYLLGTALIRAGEVKRGEAVVDSILKDANSPEAHFLLASAAYANGDYPGASKEFAEALALQPELPEAWSFYGRTLLFTGDADGAANAFRRELARNPNDYEANVKLGAILSARLQYREALPFLERAHSLRPDSVEAAAELEAAKAGRPVASTRFESGLLKPGDQAPPFALSALGGGSPVTAEGPLVVIFGSYTCPQFRFGSPALNRLYERYGKQIRFEMIYIQEAHSSENWQSTINTRSGVEQPTARNATEKSGYAVSCVRKLHIGYPVAVDTMDRSVETAYHAWPSAAYLIGPSRRIAWSSRLGEFEFKPGELEKAIQEVLKR